MPYTNWNYNTPNWTNNTSPPINQQNLIDMGEALQHTNITSAQLTTLGAQPTDTLGTILTRMKQDSGGGTSTGTYSPGTICGYCSSPNFNIGQNICIFNNGTLISHFTGIILPNSTIISLLNNTSGSGINIALAVYFDKSISVQNGLIPEIYTTIQALKSDTITTTASFSQANTVSAIDATYETTDNMLGMHKLLINYYVGNAVKTFDFNSYLLVDGGFSVAATKSS